MNKIALSIAGLFLMVALFLFLNPLKDGSPKYSPELTDKDCPAALDVFLHTTERFIDIDTGADSIWDADQKAWRPTEEAANDFLESIGCDKLVNSLRLPPAITSPRCVDAMLAFYRAYPGDIIPQEAVDIERSRVNCPDPATPGPISIDHDAAPPLPSGDMTLEFGGNTSYYLIHFATPEWSLGVKLDGTVDTSGNLPDDMYTQFWELLAGAFPEWRKKACLP